MASFRCYDNSDVVVTPNHNKFSSLSNTAVVIIFQVFVNGDVVYAQTWGGGGGALIPQKSYQATLIWNCISTTFHQSPRKIRLKLNERKSCFRDLRERR